MQRIAGLGRVAGVTVVDNSGNLPEVTVPGVRVLRPGMNLGFGAGVNLAVRQTHAPLVLLVNPDASIRDHDLEVLGEELLRHDELGAVGPRLLNADGSPQVNGAAWSGWARELSRALGIGRLLRRGRATVRREMHARPRVRVFFRDWLSGAVVLIRRRAFEAVGGFDEEFFLYHEDEDLCRRLRARGWRVGICPGSSAVHAVGGSVDGDPYLRRSFEESRQLYHRRHSGPLLQRFVRWDAQRRMSGRTRG